MGEIDDRRIKRKRMEEEKNRFMFTSSPLAATVVPVRTSLDNRRYCDERGWLREEEESKSF